MLDHISIGVRDIKRARSFYDAALAPLGYAASATTARRSATARKQAALWVGEAKRPVPADPESGLHICFAAPTRAERRCVSRRGAEGRRLETTASPALRADYGPNYYAAFVVDPRRLSAGSLLRQGGRLGLRHGLDQRSQRHQRRRIGNAVDARLAEMALEGDDDVARDVVVGAALLDAVAVGLQEPLHAAARLRRCSRSSASCRAR